MKTLAEMTADELRQLADLKDKMDTIFGERTKPTVSVGIRSYGVVRKKLHWSQTPEGRAKLARVQRRRWRKARR